MISKSRRCGLFARIRAYGTAPASRGNLGHSGFVFVGHCLREEMVYADTHGARGRLVSQP